MERLFRYLLVLTALLAIAAFGTHFLHADDPVAPVQAPPPRAARPLEPVEVIDVKVETKFLVKPKELSAAVKNGLAFLLKHQQEDGGWNQGGGWRLGKNGGSRVDGPQVADPSDIGNTSLVMLALLRAGNSPVEGQYKEAMTKGLDFILSRVEKADANSLSITDVQGTQLQSKIGQYVDTFLTALILAELRGKAGAKEKHLVDALQKTMTKIVKNQTADGGFVNNGGWAPILSVAIANKSIARAKQNGVVIDDRYFERAFAQSQASANGTVAMAGTTKAGAPVGGMMGMAGGMSGLGGIGGGGASGAGAFSGVDGTRSKATFGDAGVTLYRLGQAAGNSQDVVNSLRFDSEKAKQILKDAKATEKDKVAAQKKLDDIAKTEKENAKVQDQLAANVSKDQFTAGFGSNGGEEFLSFLNISETILVKGGKAWEEWDSKMVKGLEKAQDKDGSWSGQHCITGKTFCTAAALLVLMADRTPFAIDAIAKPAKEPEKK